MKTTKIIYWVLTILFSIMTLLGAFNFLFNSEEVFRTIFEPLGYPGAMVIPLGIAKVLGIVAILVNKFTSLKRLAYIGFILELFIALASHLVVGDNMWYAPILPLLLGIGSFLYWQKMLKLSVR